ncbi:hypothetical protein H9L19_02080 [Weissella diestrammenae]|uniref:Chemotaxis protein n=1 Tax=Weissella diestrammenae TaxID=1162633 RepID=A0A7G9T6F7_9LACO|nr:hypothetical protein [Weissella diestrammenae]MCM0583267.1 hypothetical protein [Weissella diestrammenae]QNN75682.1 hypothetical protein H9L19_02080 [Weissella diestrammenae]
MVKKQFANPRDYALKLSQIIQTTEDAGTAVADYFEKLRSAIDEDRVKALPKAEFEEISAEFDDVVAVYKNADQALNDLKAPVRLIGVHGSLVNTFHQYYEATIVMANALNVEQQTVDLPVFEQSEQDQDRLIEDFMKQVRRAFQMVM